jgi:hypothetical protein
MTLGCLHNFTLCSPSQYMFESVNNIMGEETKE